MLSSTGPIPNLRPIVSFIFCWILKCVILILLCSFLNMLFVNCLTFNPVVHGRSYNRPIDFRFISVGINLSHNILVTFCHLNQTSLILLVTHPPFLHYYV